MSKYYIETIATMTSTDEILTLARNAQKNAFITLVECYIRANEIDNAITIKVYGEKLHMTEQNFNKMVNAYKFLQSINFDLEKDIAFSKVYLLSSGNNLELLKSYTGKSTKQLLAMGRTKVEELLKEAKEETTTSETEKKNVSVETETETEKKNVSVETETEKKTETETEKDNLIIISDEDGHKKYISKKLFDSLKDFEE